MDLLLFSVTILYAVGQKTPSKIELQYLPKTGIKNFRFISARQQLIFL